MRKMKTKSLFLVLLLTLSVLPLRSQVRNEAMGSLRVDRDRVRIALAGARSRLLPHCRSGRTRPLRSRVGAVVGYHDYLAAVRRIGRPAAGCLFIDDTLLNVEAAQREGLQGAWLDIREKDALKIILKDYQ